MSEGYMKMKARLMYAKHELSVIADKLRMAFVWHLPRWIVYLSAIRVVAEATTGDNGHINPNELKAMDAIGMWESAK